MSIANTFRPVATSPTNRSRCDQPITAPIVAITNVMADSMRSIAGPRCAQQGSRALSQYRVAAAILRHIAIRWTAFQLKIRIGTGLDEQPGDVERRDRILTREHRHRAVSLDRQRADVRGHVQRRPAEQVPLVDIGAGFDHVGRELEVEIEQRHVERRDAFRIFEIGIGPGRDQVIWLGKEAEPRLRAAA